ncbi:DUF397 domain-containing protein [Streptomyces sp. A3M-1-3]|uniref:DUF397 domain-containing protein n=1 Tax=Streptomyces sp. A3M-1-3 TaxID=2962044 RepID=UPI0020B7A8EA|nr:DUF397 domain-containing protein [Streptomyces sp. A3M-1-3]MCP3821025.1 DUF397 domain-containing protein [Streptomyces sp. A3M-1-3]
MPRRSSTSTAKSSPAWRRSLSTRRNHETSSTPSPRACEGRPVFADSWQKSSYCGEGESCVHVAAAPDRTVRLTESSDPRGSILLTDPDTWSALLRAIKENHV